MNGLCRKASQARSKLSFIPIYVSDHEKRGGCQKSEAGIGGSDSSTYTI